ncbi:hypothetical protein GCM10023331_02310 [Algivirga pacifica]|uniref:Uncharacterized protein n=2 Tax=Algivirga pacifica TaxID=1162670 RepID=A0ABP9CXS0_9BACT
MLLLGFFSCENKDELSPLEEQLPVDSPPSPAWKTSLTPVMKKAVYKDTLSMPARIPEYVSEE